MIETITITDFRNHASDRIKTGGAKNIVITGPNGSGKTSVLEAISILSQSGSLRGAAPAEMIRIPDAVGFGVATTLADGSEISMSFAAGDVKRRVRIDGDAAPISDIGKHARVLWLTPKEDRLFADAPSERRAFFDRMCASLDSAHGARIVRMGKLLHERAFALKNGSNDSWLNSIEHQLGATAIAVAAARVRYAGEINYFLKDSSYAVAVSGMLEERLGAGMSAADAEREYAEYLRANRELIADKMNMDGPHRTDFGMINGRLNMPVANTSTGQQKSALLQLVMSNAKLVRARAGLPVFILLDEVAAHLDAAARAALFVELQATDAQIWMTGLEMESFAGIADAKFVYCENGICV
ncbi:MAG: AAA family ATPase [Rickettsiales bacterium]|jgi:DNA replication and repair protein RecF|nr:AAA family ATPase [Rickettsiales bacterium]